MSQDADDDATGSYGPFTPGFLKVPYGDLGAIVLRCVLEDHIQVGGGDEAGHDARRTVASMCEYRFARGFHTFSGGPSNS